MGEAHKPTCKSNTKEWIRNILYPEAQVPENNNCTALYYLHTTSTRNLTPVRGTVRMKWVEGSGPTDKIRANSEDMTLTFNWLLKCEFFNWLGQLIFLQASFVMAEVCRVALLGDRSVATHGMKWVKYPRGNASTSISFLFVFDAVNWFRKDSLSAT